MAVIPLHLKPTTKQDCIDTWKRFLRFSPPSHGQVIKEYRIKHWVDTTSWDGKPLDALLYVHTTINEEPKPMGLIFGDQMPDDRYPIHVLWVRNGEMEWLPRLRQTDGAAAGG